MHFKADADQAKETERRLRLNDAVLRQLVIRKDD
jgi:ribosomal protein S6